MPRTELVYTPIDDIPQVRRSNSNRTGTGPSPPTDPRQPAEELSRRQTQAHRIAQEPDPSARLPLEVTLCVLISFLASATMDEGSSLTNQRSLELDTIINDCNIAYPLPRQSESEARFRIFDRAQSVLADSKSEANTLQCVTVGDRDA